MRAAAPLLVGAAAALLAGALVWALVGERVVEWESGAFAAVQQTVLVVLAAVIAGAAGTVLSWRALMGPPVEHIEWTLTLRADPPRERGPAAVPPGLSDLLSALRSRGYDLGAAAVDDAGRRLRPAAPDEPLCGRPLEVVIAGAPARLGRVVLRVPTPPVDEGLALGFIDVYGAIDGRYDELGQFVIAALGRLFPALTYKRFDSALSDEPAAALWAELPERPRHLGASAADQGRGAA